MSDNQQLPTPPSPSSSDVSPVKGGAFLFYVTLISGLAGFGLTVARARKSAPKDVNNLNAEGTRLALRALGYGTAISVTGCGLLMFGVAKALGVSSAKEFGLKMKGVMPSKDGEFVHKFDNWPTKMELKEDDGKWREEFK
ncbi:transmembrane protein 242-like [Clytia hemisphaerica]|uniref:transmembrane protein 242-like n=1 Tax=Clytia hemisphaerica TaxID=252671 RepID=UPI0034D6B700